MGTRGTLTQNCSARNCVVKLDFKTRGATWSNVLERRLFVVGTDLCAQLIDTRLCRWWSGLSCSEAQSNNFIFGPVQESLHSRCLSAPNKH